MASLKDRLTQRVDQVRERKPLVDHGVSTVQHYSEVNGSGLAGAITFYGFLSFFPILALAFFVIGHVANLYDGAEADLVSAINSLLPGMIGDGEGQISLEVFKANAGSVGLIGLVGVLYTGLGWLSGMRGALLAMFMMPATGQPNFVVGKARDLVVLAAVGLILMVSVALSSFVTGLSERILKLLDLYDVDGVPTLVTFLGAFLAFLASTVLFLAFFKLLVKPHLPNKALVHGALLAAFAFEVLKVVATTLIATTKSQPAFQAFGVALVLLVWINYFARVTMFGAAWAYTSSLAVRKRARDEART